MKRDLYSSIHSPKKLLFMANGSVPAGIKISAIQADEYIQKHRAVKANLIKEKVIPLAPPPKTISEDERMEVNAFYDSEVNAFVFDKALILELLHIVDAKGNEPDYLMVILGAKHKIEEGIVQGKSTVVVAGVKKSGNDYFSLDVPLDAGEQPPTASILRFPPPFGINNLIPTQIDLVL